jgi:hypothetical protein
MHESADPPPNIRDASLIKRRPNTRFSRWGIFRRRDSEQGHINYRGIHPSRFIDPLYYFERRRLMESKHCVQRYLTGLILIVLLLGSNASSVALELSIIESGPTSNPEIGLWARDFDNSFFGVERLVAPSGDLFTPASILKGDRFRILLMRFGSLSDAMNYVDGTWQATPTSPFPFPSPSPQPFDFNIDAIPMETINRTPPTLISPSPGAEIKSGATFTFAWD